MKRFTRVAVVATAGLGLLLGATPAHAHPHHGLTAFTGSANTDATFAPTFGPAVADGTWALVALGVGASSSDGVGNASISASGRYHVGIVNAFGHGAYCGLSGGSDGTGTVTFGATTVNLLDVGWSQSAGSVIVFTGDTRGPDSTGEVTGGLAGVVVAQGGAPCVGAGATSFTVVGAAVATW